VENQDLDGYGIVPMMTARKMIRVQLVGQSRSDDT